VLQAQPTPRYNYDDYVSELLGRLQSAHAIARENLVQSKARSKVDYDTKAVHIAPRVGGQGPPLAASDPRVPIFKLDQFKV